MSPFIATFAAPAVANDAVWRRRADKFLLEFAPDAIHPWFDNTSWALQAAMHTTADAVASNRPYQSHDNRYVVIFDGWLENYDELVTELQPSGQVNPPLTDQDITYLAFRRWGTSMAQHLYGEYAILIWDREKQALLAIRDKVGIRPLFFTLIRGGAGGIALSNLPGLLAMVPGVGDEIDFGYLAEFLCADECSLGDTLYRNVKRVLGGRVLTWAAGSAPQISTYWQPNCDVRTDETEADLIEEFRCLLEQTVKSATRSAVGVGCQISGGVDSSTVGVVLGKLQRQGSLEATKLRGASLVYPGLSCDESIYIDAIAQSLPFPLMRQEATVPSLADLSLHTTRLRHPYYPGVALEAFAGLARSLRADGCRVVLTGDGGDELFWPTEYALRGALLSTRQWPAGMQYLRNNWRSRPTGFRPFSLGRHLLEPVFGTRLHNVVSKHHDRKRTAHRWPVDESWRRSVRLHDRLDTLRAMSCARCSSAAGALNGLFSPFWESSSAFGLLHGVEFRHPLSSARLTELANRLPLSLLDGVAPLSRWPMRCAVAGFLPDLTALRNNKAEFTCATLPVLVALCAEQFARKGDVGVSSSLRLENQAPESAAGTVTVDLRDRRIWLLASALSASQWLADIQWKNIKFRLSSD